MEGLLIAEVLRALEPQLPSARLSWRFPDAHTFVLPLKTGALWLYNKPPNARLAYQREMPPPGGTHSGFQDLLVARAGGRLEGAEQLKLDRVAKFYFEGAEGFVRTDPVVLVAELTGRNCNLILTDPDGLILGVAREVTRDINRFRQLGPGIPYEPPPPYEKLDPRGASDEEMSEVLVGEKLKNIRSLVDGFGSDLSRTLELAAGVPRSRVLSKEDMDALLPTLRRVVEEPSATMRAVLSLPDVETLRQAEAREVTLQRLRSALSEKRKLVEKRLEDINRTRQAAGEADVLRGQADVLMAFQHQVVPNASEVTLTDFEGKPLTLALEPQRSAVENAQRLYERAKKREARLTGAERREEDLVGELVEVEGLLASLGDLNTDELNALADIHVKKPKTQHRTEPGIRYKSPQGYRVLVGRNARDNDTVTFKLARSRDLWLHAQGYPGSHVVIQAENSEVPFETVLYAAQLAAAYSKAGESDNVPVDYTLRKNVWKPKGAPPGAVHFSQQKTVYVTPSRRPDAE